MKLSKGFIIINFKCAAIAMHFESVGVFAVGEKTIACFTTVSQIENHCFRKMSYSFFYGE